MGTEIFPEGDALFYRIRLRAPVGMRIEETERVVLHALDIVGREAGAGKVAITSDFMGVQPSSYPVNLIHLFTAGPQEAIIQVSLKPDALRGEAAPRTPARQLSPANCRARRSPSRPATLSAR